MTERSRAENAPRCHVCGGAIDRAKVLMWAEGFGTVLCDMCGTLALLAGEDDLLSGRS